MPVVSISVPVDLFKKLEDRKGRSTRSATWAFFLDNGLKMDGHVCPKAKAPRWADDHECPEAVPDYFARNMRKFGKDGWVHTLGGIKYRVKTEE